MRRTVKVLLGVGLLAGATALYGGCTLFHESFPGTECTSNSDCFQAQGEKCNLATNRCEVPPPPDASFDAKPPPDAGPDAEVFDAGPDAEVFDAGPDAEILDAEAPDA